jgi:hypothetical protein
MGGAVAGVIREMRIGLFARMVFEQSLQFSQHIHA